MVWPVASCCWMSASWACWVLAVISYLDPCGQRVCLGWHGQIVLLDLRLWLSELVARLFNSPVTSQAGEMEL